MEPGQMFLSQSLPVQATSVRTRRSDIQEGRGLLLAARRFVLLRVNLTQRVGGSPFLGRKSVVTCKM